MFSILFFLLLLSLSPLTVYRIEFDCQGISDSFYKVSLQPSFEFQKTKYENTKQHRHERYFQSFQL